MLICDGKEIYSEIWSYIHLTWKNKKYKYYSFFF